MENDNDCKCGKNPESDESHPCPYHEEINGDCDDRCNCCDECVHDCCMAI